MERMTLVQVLHDEAERTYGVAERLFDRVEDRDLSWTPPTGRNWMTVGRLLRHCAEFGCGKAVQGFVHGDWGLSEGTPIEDLASSNHVPPAEALPTVESVDQARRLLAEDRRLTLRCLAEIREEDLLGPPFSAPWGGPDLSLFQHLLLMIAHLSQHKGQLFYYLKLLDRDVDSTDLWGS